MSGKRGANYREGDLSEYLAQYLLSRFSFVNHVPRQEDFGIADFLCVLGKKYSTNVYPEFGFYAQVKSTEDDVIFDKDSSRWISLHMDLPLIICIINKKTSHIKLYSCCKIWAGLFVITSPDQLILKLNEGTDSQIVDINHKDRILTIPVGLPILSMDIDEIEKNKDNCYNILKPWLALDKMNIARRSIGRIFSSGYLNWTENEKPKGQFNQYAFGPGYPVAEKDIAQILTALAHNYKHNKIQDKLVDLINYLKHFDNYLDQHGKDFVSGKLKIEE